MLTRRGRQKALENRMETWMLVLEASVPQRFDLLPGQIAELDNRLSVVDDRWKRPQQDHLTVTWIGITSPVCSIRTLSTPGLASLAATSVISAFSPASKSA